MPDRGAGKYMNKRIIDINIEKKAFYPETTSD